MRTGILLGLAWVVGASTPATPKTAERSVAEVSRLPWEDGVDGVEHCGWVVKFYHPECGGCRLVEQPYEDAARETVGGCRILKVNCIEHADYCMQHQAVEYPHIAYYNAKGEPTAGPLDIPDTSDQDVLRTLIENFITSNCGGRDADCGVKRVLPHKAQLDVVQGDEVAKQSVQGDPQLKVWIEDLRKGLYEALTAHEVEEGHGSAKKNLVKLAKQTFPDRAVRERLSLTDFKFLVESDDRRYEAWRGCKGMSCALWQLFHSLSLGCLGTECKGDIHPLRVMRDWVVGYYNCKVCRSHFSANTAEWAASTLTPAEAVLQLWSIHNDVTLRVKDAAEPFPSRDLCPSCYPSKFSPRVSSRAVLDFLVEYYPTHRQPVLNSLPDSAPHRLWVPLAGLLITLCLWRRKRHFFAHPYRKMLGLPPHTKEGSDVEV